MDKCEKHPKYTGRRKPRYRDESGNFCPDCLALYLEKKKTGEKATRTSKKAEKANLKLARQQWKEEQQLPVEVAEAIENTVEELVSEADDGDDCGCDDTLINAAIAEVVDNEGWDFEDDEDVDFEE